MIGVCGLLAISTAIGAALGSFVGLLHPSSGESIRQLLTNVSLGEASAFQVTAAGGLATYIGLKPAS